MPRPQPGHHVREQGRPEGGGLLLAIQPAGMADVRERDGYSRRRPYAKLVRVDARTWRNPVANGIARANPKKKASRGPTVRIRPALTLDEQYVARNVAGVLRSLPVRDESPRARLSRAFAIAVGRLQQHGYIRKGTMKLTPAGKARAAVLAAEPHHQDALTEYEVALAEARMGNTARVIQAAQGYTVEPAHRSVATLVGVDTTAYTPAELAAIGGAATQRVLAHKAEAKARAAKIRADKAAAATQAKPSKTAPKGKGKKAPMKKRTSQAKTHRRRGPSPAKRAAGKTAAAKLGRSSSGRFTKKANPRGLTARWNGGGRSPTAANVEKMRRVGHTRATAEGPTEMVFLPEHGLVMAILGSQHLRVLRATLPNVMQHWITEERAIERRIDEETLREYAAPGTRVILCELDSLVSIRGPDQRTHRIPAAIAFANVVSPQLGPAAIRGLVYSSSQGFHVGGMTRTFHTRKAATEARDLLLRRGRHFGGRWSSGHRGDE